MNAILSIFDISLVYSEEDCTEDGSKSVGSVIKSSCPSLYYKGAKRMVPTPYLCNGWLQTIYLAKIVRRWDELSDIKYDRELLELDDKGVVSLDWYPRRPGTTTEPLDQPGTPMLDANAPIVVIVPSACGSSQEYPLRCLARKCSHQYSMRAVVLNHRGCSSTPLKTARLHSADYTHDLHAALVHIQHKAPLARVSALGFSIGANIVTKYTGEQRGNCRLTAAVAVCCPFDVPRAFTHMCRESLPNNILVQPVLTATFKKYALRHQQVIQQHLVGSKQGLDFDRIRKATGIRELNELVIAPVSGFESRDEYYQVASSARVVPGIRVPYLAINSKDDPLFPLDTIPMESIRRNPYTALALVRNGGHLGFLTG
ncbi:hypothetical protein IWW50_006258, partial [Coemansia erecta]